MVTCVVKRLKVFHKHHRDGQRSREVLEIEPGLFEVLSKCKNMESLAELWMVFEVSGSDSKSILNFIS